MQPPSLDIAQVVALALVQGATEFLPVSSSAHLILPAALLGWNDQGLAFDAAVHLGTLLAAIAYFRRDVAGLVRGGAALLARREGGADAELLLRVGVATVPVLVVGALFKEQIEAHLRAATVIALTTIAFGVLLWWADRRRERLAAPPMPTYGQALLIGVAQTLALIPGTSRAGVTIAAALALGFARTGAVRFSFLLAIPAIAGAAALTAWDAGRGAALPWPSLATGFAVAAASAFLCIGALLRFVERIGMAPFAIYRIALGVALLALVHVFRVGTT